MRLEEHGAERGAERQRDEAGDHCRGRDRHRELTEEQPGDAGDEGGRHEDGAQREGDRDQRPADFVHRPMGCLQGRHAVAHVALDVFNDDDRVVDDDADREHEAEQGQVVERYAEGHEDRERPDEGDRDRDDRNDGRAPALQEEEYDAHHQKDCHENRDDDLVDRLRDEDGRVIDDDRVDAGREILLQLLHRRHDFLIDRERVGAGLGIDEQDRRIAAVHVGGAAVIRGADLDPTDVAHAGHASSTVGFDDDVGELLGRGQPAERFDVDLIGLVARGRRLVQDTGRDLEILRAQRRERVAGGEIVGRGLVRVEPDAHRVFATADELHVADARQARQHVLDVQGRVVRQVQHVARLVRRVEVNGQQNAGYRLADLHAQALDVLWQAR